MKGKNILLVEDDQFIVDIYTTELKEAGFSVENVNDGADVLKKIKEMNPDLILLDIVLPGMNGWEILEMMHNMNEYKKLPVIILSNLYQKEEVERGMKLGAAKYMIKAHHTPSEVVMEIKNILG
ncbi:MAG: response regulator [Candidatus Nealsonbacteria bacterium]